MSTAMDQPSLNVGSGTSGNDLFDLTGRVAVVTGGGSGIGLGIAPSLARFGAEIVVAARGVDRGEAAADELCASRARTHFFPVDVADPQSCQALIPAVTAITGRLDILVNNAGINLPKAAQDVPSMTGGPCSTRI